MTELFLDVVNMSISADWIVLAVIVLRLLLKRAPKWISVLLWGIVGVRLVCPFTVESVLSLIPSTETVTPEIMLQKEPSVNTGVPVLNSVINPVISESFAPEPLTSANPLQILIPVLSQIWLLGIVLMLAYTVVSYVRLKLKISTAVKLRGNVYQSESVASPFVLGIVKPRIYLPFSIDEKDASHVIAHENAHLRRKDHLWKPLGFLILTLHWFNPLMWLGYVLLCRDIEYACDEKVIRELGASGKADYSEALLACGVSRRMIAACPLAFGEVGVKSRIKSVLSYKKPTLWIMIVAILASIAAAVCFLTSPKKNDDGVLPLGVGAELEGVSLEIVKTELSFPDPYIEIRWKNETDERIVYGSEFKILREVDRGWENCSIAENPVWNLIAHHVEANSESTKKYKLNGQIMTATGKYRFETPFTVGEDAERRYTAWMEFELKESVALADPHTFKPVKIVYDDGMYSFAQTVETAPTYILANGMQLFEKADGEISGPLGTLEETVLNESTFDSMFPYNTSWREDESLDGLKENNERFWTLHGESESLYMLLKQSDGTFYLGVGYYYPEAPDKSHVRWLYKLEEMRTEQNASASKGVFTAADMLALKSKYPHYFDLSTENGLDVYIWQMAENSYSCHLVPGSALDKSSSELLPLDKLFPQESSTELWEMKAIIADYITNGNILKENVRIYPTKVMYSSYFYTIDDTYSSALTRLFWEDFPIVENTKYVPVITSAVFDIDGDGNEDRCVLSYGPTSGLYTVILTVFDEVSSLPPKYATVIYGISVGETSFENKDGEMKLKVIRQGDGSAAWYSLGVKDGNVVMSTDESGK